MQTTSTEAALPAAHEPPILRRSGLGWVLLILNLFVAFGSTSYFFFHLRVGFAPWAMMNVCAIAGLLFALGFLTRSLVVLTASTAFLFFYGVSGLFAFGWDVFVLGAQIGHILMILTGVYVATAVIRLHAWRPLVLGLLLGIVLLVPHAIIANAWGASHPELMQRFLSGDLMRPVA